MYTYYIKMIYGNDGHVPRPWKEGGEYNLHFTAEQKALCNRFTDASGFLVYETGQNGGKRVIFGRGTILSLNCEDVWAEDPVEDHNGTRYPLGAKVIFEKLIAPEKGIPLEEIYELCPRLQNHFLRSQGGLIGIQPDEFKALAEALDKRAA